MLDFLTTTAYGRAFTVGIIALIFYTPFCLSIGVEKMVYGKKIPGGRYWQSFIPIWNIIKADKQYFGHAHFASWAQLGLLGFPIRLIAAYISVTSPALYYVTFGIMVIGIIVYYVSCVYTAFTIIHDASVIGVGGTVILAIFFPLGFMYIGNVLAGEINSKAKRLDSKRGF